MKKSKAKEKQHKVTFYISRSLYRAFRVLAVVRGRTMTWYLKGSVERIVKGEKRKKKKGVESGKAKEGE